MEWMAPRGEINYIMHWAGIALLEEGCTYGSPIMLLPTYDPGAFSYPIDLSLSTCAMWRLSDLLNVLV